MLRAIRRLFFRLVLAVLVLVAGIAVWDFATYDAEAWHRDYVHVKHELAHRYANLDWVVEHRHLDLLALDRETEAEILSAHSRLFAFLAVRRFVRAFRDPHLRLVWADRSAAPAQVDAGPAPAPALATFDAARYEAEDVAFRFPFHLLPGWTPMANAPFPTGIANDLGVLRIASFGEDRYRAIAEPVFEGGMRRDELKLAVRARLQQELRSAIAALRERGCKRLVVDLTGNGGGTEWVTEVVALFTDRELERRAARLLATGVDRKGIWNGQRVPSVLAPEEAPQRLRGTGEWNGPVFVLVDRHTGSASEDFVVWLKENGVAKVLGERTAGAGGGYVDGGGRIRLATWPVEVMAPNCARFLADGTNEIEGIAPDVELPMAGGAPAALAAAFAAAVAH